MAVWRTRLVSRIPGSSVWAESPTSRIGPISFGMKQAGKPSAGKPPAGFDAAGAGNRPTVRLVRHSQRKRGATDRLSLRGNRRQSSTLLMSGEGKRAIGTAPLLDSTQEVEIFGMKCRRLTLARLIEVKCAAGRPKDLEAIAELKALQQEEKD